MSSTETLLKPSAARMPAQTSWMIASIDIVWVRRAETRSSCSSAVRWRAASAAARASCTAWAAWAASAARTARSSSDGRRPGDRLVDGHDAEHVALAVAQRHEERVLGMPGVGAVGHLDVGHEGDARVEGPVELVPGQQEAAVRLEAQVEERLQSLHVRSRPSSASRPSARAVDGLDAEVVPGRAVERDDDGPVAHGLADGGGDRGQQRVEVLLAAHEPRDLEQAGEPRDGVRAVLGKSHQPGLIGRHPSRLKRRWTRLGAR